MNGVLYVVDRGGQANRKFATSWAHSAIRKSANFKFYDKYTNRKKAAKLPVTTFI
jgi:hypothetical protein